MPGERHGFQIVEYPNSGDKVSNTSSWHLAKLKMLSCTQTAARILRAEGPVLQQRSMCCAADAMPLSATADIHPSCGSICGYICRAC